MKRDSAKDTTTATMKLQHVTLFIYWTESLRKTWQPEDLKYSYKFFSKIRLTYVRKRERKNLKRNLGLMY